MKRQHDKLIGGEWIKGNSYSPNRDPSNLADTLAECAQGDGAQVNAAVAAATAALPAWANGSIQARSDALGMIGNEILARKEELGTLLSREEGKTRAEGIGEAIRAGHIFKFFAGECLRLPGEVIPSVRPEIGVEITREPVGVGRAIALKCVQSHKKMQLEMGGKNPQVVLDDADVTHAVALSVQSAFYSTGQRCTAASRLIVNEGIYPKFIEAMKPRMQRIKGGDALAQGTDIGPVSSQGQLEQDSSYGPREQGRYAQEFFTTVKTAYTLA